MKQEMERRLSSFGFKPEDIEGFVDKQQIELYRDIKEEKLWHE